MYIVTGIISGSVKASFRAINIFFKGLSFSSQGCLKPRGPWRIVTQSSSSELGCMGESFQDLEADFP